MDPFRSKKRRFDQVSESPEFPNTHGPTPALVRPRTLGVPIRSPMERGSDHSISHAEGAWGVQEESPMESPSGGELPQTRASRNGIATTIQDVFTTDRSPRRTGCRT